MMGRTASLVVVLCIACLHHSLAFTSHSFSNKNSVDSNGETLQRRLSPDDDQDGAPSADRYLSRREAISLGILSTVSLFVGLSPQESVAEDGVYRPAIRPTAYLVDSTIPPTLLPLNARKESAILSALGRGSGTNKDAIVDDSVNLNNILNKAVFGTIDAVSSLAGTSEKEDIKSGPGYASFVCLGVPSETQPVDVDLAVGLLTPMFQARKSKAETALGLAFAPLSTQSALDTYLQDGNADSLRDALVGAGVTESTIQLYTPLSQLAHDRGIKLLALSPEVEDVQTVRRDGLQNVNTDRRAQYVVDPEGFIALTQDPKFKLYTDRSLLKDFRPTDNKDLEGNFFAERILVHETGATALAKYTASRPDSFVAAVAPTPDVRFLGGINGRIPRVCGYLNKETNKVTMDAVTTILLNPTAKETLSLSRSLRLEIGTAPENIDFQTKVADYLWFSSMPKVNLIPRLMNAR